MLPYGTIGPGYSHASESFELSVRFHANHKGTITFFVQRGADEKIIHAMRIVILAAPCRDEGKWAEIGDGRNPYASSVIACKGDLGCSYIRAQARKFP